MRYGYVYILCSQKNGTIYVGMSSDLTGRLEQHKSPDLAG
ncbi:MAG: GIY-YIG nuclease family protein [Hellea sp.]